MCGCNSSPRSNGAIEASFSDSQRKGDFPMATLPVLDIPRGHSFCCPTLPDDTGRDKGEDVAGSPRHTRASPDCRLGNKAKRGKELQQKKSTNFDISDSQRRIGTLESTTERRLDCESAGLSACDRVKSVSGECSSGMDGVFVMRSSLESHDMARTSGHDTTPLDASMSRLWKNDALSTNIRQEGDVLWLQSISTMQKSGGRTTSCFTVCALVLGGTTSRDSGDTNGRRISQLGGQLQHVGSSSRHTTRQRFLVGATPVSFGFWNQRAEGSQLYPDQQKKDMVAQQIKKLQGTLKLK